MAKKVVSEGALDGLLEGDSLRSAFRRRRDEFEYAKVSPKEEKELSESGWSVHKRTQSSVSYKSNLVWHKIRKDGGSDGRGVGFYFRNVTELVLFGVKGKHARTLDPGRSQVNLLATRKREHSRKPDELYEIIESCSPGPYLELFARGTRRRWLAWGNQANDDYFPTWNTYAHHSQAAE
jgi:hypothetical protein